MYKKFTVFTDHQFDFCVSETVGEQLIKIQNAKTPPGKVRSLHDICLNFAVLNPNIIDLNKLTSDDLDNIKNHQVFENNIILNKYVLTIEDLWEKNIQIERHKMITGSNPTGSTPVHMVFIKANDKKNIYFPGIKSRQVKYENARNYIFNRFPLSFCPKTTRRADIEIKKNNEKIPVAIKITESGCMTIELGNIKYDDIIEIPEFVLCYK